MSKTRNLTHTTAIVKEILLQDEKARNSDSFLYLQVIKQMGKEKNISVNHLPVTLFLLYMDSMGFPPFESVRRARQKLQAAYPELAASERVKAFRSENEAEYRAYVRSSENGR